MKFNLDVIKQILIEQDVEGLIKIGAPKDEYDHEAELIFNRITNEDAEDLYKITIKIISVFFETFGTSVNCEKEVHSLKFSAKSINNFLTDYINIAKLILDSAEKE